MYLEVGTAESDPGPRIARLKSLANADHPESATAAFYYGLVLLGELQLMAPGPSTRSVEWTKFLEYFAAIGLENREQEARSYIEKAAYLDFTPAQTRIGKAYEFSEMGLEQEKLSVQYYGLASAQGDPHADMALSRWFARGIDGLFPPDAYMVYAFAAKAARSGESGARRLVDLCRDLQITSREDQYLGVPWYGQVCAFCDQRLRMLIKLPLYRQPTYCLGSTKKHIHLLCLCTQMGTLCKRPTIPLPLKRRKTCLRSCASHLLVRRGRQLHVRWVPS